MAKKNIINKMSLMRIATIFFLFFIFKEYGASLYPWLPQTVYIQLILSLILVYLAEVYSLYKRVKYYG